MSDHGKWVCQYLAGASLRSIAQEAGVDLKIIRAELVSQGVQVRRPGPKQVDLTVANEWPALYLSGLTLREIAMRSDVSHPTVRKYLIMRGVNLRSEHRPPSVNALWHYEAVKLHSEGWSYKAIAEHFGKAVPTVFSAIKRLSA